MDVFVGNLLESTAFEDETSGFSRPHPWET